MQITIEAIKERSGGKWFGVLAGGKWYSWPIKCGTPVKGQTHNVNVKEGEYNGKPTYTVESLMQGTPSSSLAANPPKYSEDDKKAFKEKDEKIIRMAALKSSAEMVRANAHVLAVSDTCKGFTKEEVKDWLGKIQHDSFNQFVMLVNDEIPF